MTMLLTGTGGGAAAFAPTDIAGLKVWLKADALSLNDADPVTTWTDSSGSGNNAAQAVAGAKPTYKTNILNGKPIVRFDGTGDYMTIADNANYKTANITLFVVIKATNIGATLVGYPHDVTHTSPYFRWLFYKYNATQLELRWNGIGGVNATAMDSTNWFILEELDSDAYVNGTLKIDGADADLTYPNAVGIYIGANSSAGELLEGDIAEILLYDSSLSVGDRALVRSYLVTKYNITVV